MISTIRAKSTRQASARRRTRTIGALHSTRPTARICSTCSTSAAIATCSISISHSNNGRNYDFDGDEAADSDSRQCGAGDSPLADEYVEERYYGSYGALIWDTTSESRTHELRFTSPDDAERLTWAVGVYKFKEEQAVFLGIPLDYTDLPYLEFNQGETIGESESVYADITFALTERLRITGGARYSDESKERDGFNFIAGFDTNGVAMRTGTPGFRMTGLSRGIMSPDANGDGVRNTLEDFVLLYQAGVASFGVNDTLDEFLAGQCVQASQFGGTCAGYPGLGLAFGGATVQHGENSDQYVDWRFRIGYDLTDDNLLYFLVATGNKAPSFNDTVDLDTGPGEDLFTPPVGPEKNTMFEIGSKNEFTVGGNVLLLNASAYYLEYTDQVFSTLVGIQLLDTDPTNDIGCTDTDPDTQCSDRDTESEHRRSDQHGHSARRAPTTSGRASTAAARCCGRTRSTRRALSPTVGATVRAAAHCSSTSKATSCRGRPRSL